MSSEVDINILISIYNQKIANLTNQNILLEAKLQSLTKDFETEKNNLLMQLLELNKNDEVASKVKSKKTDQEYLNSEVG